MTSRGRGRFLLLFPCPPLPLIFACIGPVGRVSQLHGSDALGQRLCNQDGTPKPNLVERWIEWRRREDAELVRLGIHKAPTSAIQQFRTASRSHIPVAQ